MIRWLVQAPDPGSRMSLGLPPAGLLCAAEQARLEELGCTKRRRDWLVGRWTAKCLLQAHLRRLTGKLLPLDNFAVENDPSHAPFGLWRSHQGWLALPISLTISHSDAHAFCALIQDSRWVVGGDLESIAPRSEGFIQEYFTPIEIAQVNETEQALQPCLATAIWSAKEAALKSLHLGLSVDTRAVTCRIGPLKMLPHTWQPFEIQSNPEWLPGEPARLHGWWRVIDPFVVTVACKLRLPAELAVLPGEKCSIKY